MYRYPNNTTVELFESGMAFLRPQAWSVPRAIKRNQPAIKRATLYQSDDGEVVLTDEDVAGMLVQTQEWADEETVSADMPEILVAEPLE